MSIARNDPESEVSPETTGYDPTTNKNILKITYQNNTQIILDL